MTLLAAAAGGLARFQAVFSSSISANVFRFLICAMMGQDRIECPGGPRSANRE